MEWREIESAPKDGTEIDLWVRRFKIGEAGAVSVEEVGRYPKSSWDLPRHYYPGSEPRIGDKPTWVCSENGYNFEEVETGGYRATHWMPLPPPPERKG